MNNSQIAHDLAVSKLCGQSLSNEQLIEQYKRNYDEILNYLNSRPVEPNVSKVIDNPLWG